MNSSSQKNKENRVPDTRLELGCIVATPGALAALEESRQDAGEFLGRHTAGDWGDLSDADRIENELSLENGFRLLSCTAFETW
jgi:hypothetical protein